MKRHLRHCYAVKTTVLGATVFLGLSLAFAEASVPGELFSRGAEVFEVKDAKNATPSFRVLDDTPLEQGLAYAIEATVNAQPDVKPKLPVQGYIDLKIETLTFKPLKDGKLAMLARVSGHDLDLEKSVSRAEFLAGKSILVKFEPQQKTVSAFDVNFRGGQFKFRWNSGAKELVIEDANAKVDFEAPFAGEGSESIRFTGKGRRLAPGAQTAAAPAASAAKSSGK